MSHTRRLFPSCLVGRCGGGAGSKIRRPDRSELMVRAKIRKSRPCEFRLGRDQALSSSSRANANEPEIGAGENPKGVLADKRDIDKDAKDRKSSDHESGDKPKGSFAHSGASASGAHPPVDIYHTATLCTRRDSLDLTRTVPLPKN
jgi:hypothetical protein